MVRGSISPGSFTSTYCGSSIRLFMVFWFVYVSRGLVEGIGDARGDGLGEGRGESCGELWSGGRGGGLGGRLNEGHGVFGGDVCKDCGEGCGDGLGVCRGDGTGVNRREGVGGLDGDGSADLRGVVEREDERLDPVEGGPRYCSFNLLNCVLFPSSARLPLISGTKPLFLYSSMVSVFRPVKHQQYELVGQDSSCTFVDPHLSHHGSFFSFFVNGMIGMIILPDLSSRVVSVLFNFYFSFLLFFSISTSVFFCSFQFLLQFSSVLFQFLLQFSSVLLILLQLLN